MYYIGKEGKTLKIPHRRRDYFVPVILAVAILASAICFASHASGTSTRLSRGLSLITTPFQSATKLTYDFFSTVGGYFENMEKLKSENERLSAQNKRLLEENLTVKELQSENNSLYKFLELKKEHTDYNFINGNVISRSSDGYSANFTIDKGTFHGIEENMPVISDNGALIGITYSVDSNSTRCKSILSYDVNIGVYNEETGETGVLSGSFDTFSKNKCIIRHLSEETTFLEGDRILTSGLGEIYPRGLIIGKVDGFEPEMGSHTKNAIITPDESAFVCDRVMVITSFERAYK